MRGRIAAMLWLLAAVPGLVVADTLDNEIVRLKTDVAEVSSSLYRLEQELLNPADTQLAVYLSVSAGDYFLVDAVELRIDGKVAGNHLYSEQERNALSKGGVQSLYVGNIAAGGHKLTAVLNGKGVNDRYYRKEVEFTIRKDQNARQVELVITADAPSFEPTFKLKPWN